MRTARNLVIGALAIGGLVFAVPAGGAAVAARPAPPTPLTFTDYVVPGATATAVTGYNVHGVVVGSYTDGTGQHGFVDEDLGDLAVTTIDGPPGSTDAAVTSVNDAGTITATYWQGNLERAFLRTADGTTTPIDMIGIPTGDRTGTVANQVSNAGVVVGYSFTTDLDGIIYPDGGTGPSTVSHGFVWTAETIKTVDHPYAFVDAAFNTGTQVLGVNAAGVMVGTYTLKTRTDGHNAGFVLSGKTYRTVDDSYVPRNWCGYTIPSAINDAGLVAGTSGNGCSGEYPKAWTYSKNRFTLLTGIDSEMTILTVGSINANGELAGSWAAPADGGYPNTGPVHGFIAKH